MSTQSVPNRYFGGAQQPLPPGCVVMELKYCEICGVPFSRKFSPTQPFETKEKIERWQTVVVNGRKGGQVLLGIFPVIRRKDHGVRYCKNCIGRALLPNIEEQETYKAQLPGTPNQMRHSTHLPKYDESLLSPIARATASHKVNGIAPPSRRRYIKSSEWVPLVRAEFAAKGRLTVEQIQEFVPRCWTPHDAYIRCIVAGVKLKLVARVPRTPGIRGSSAGIYEWPGVSPLSAEPIANLSVSGEASDAAKDSALCSETLYRTAKESLSVH